MSEHEDLDNLFIEISSLAQPTCAQKSLYEAIASGDPRSVHDAVLGALAEFNHSAVVPGYYNNSASDMLYWAARPYTIKRAWEEWAVYSIHHHEAIIPHVQSMQRVSDNFATRSCPSPQQIRDSVAEIVVSVFKSENGASLLKKAADSFAKNVHGERYNSTYSVEIFKDEVHKILKKRDGVAAGSRGQKKKKPSSSARRNSSMSESDDENRPRHSRSQKSSVSRRRNR